MDNSIYLIGEVGKEITLEKTINLVKKTNQKERLNVYIHSKGGGVFEGISIYSYLKHLPQGVDTFSSGMVASIASVIFLAGKNRFFNNTDNFLIHLPMGGAHGNASDLEKTAKGLREIENKLAQIYEQETNLTFDEAMDFMKKDEFIDVNILKEKGFVNEIITFKAVANFNQNKDMSEQLTKKDADTWFSKLENLLKGLRKEPVNIVLQDANGAELDFPDVEEGLSPKVGDKATIDGRPAEGEYVMPTGETYKFTAGELTEIVEVEQEQESTEEALQAEIDKLKEQLQASAELTAERETEITNLKNEIEVKNSALQNIEVEFTEIKNKVTSHFDYQEKTEIKEPVKVTKRNLLK